MIFFLKKIMDVILYCLFIFNSNIFISLIYATDIVPDDSTNTNAYIGANGTPVIEIAPTNDRGVSLNRYNDYNVDRRNLVINNSNVPINSKLAGAIDRNNNFNGSGGANKIMDKYNDKSKDR